MEVRSAHDIAASLFKEAGYKSEGNGKLGDASQYYLTKKTKAQLINFLREEFIIEKPSDLQFKVGRQNWERIYTTNYDEIIEMSGSHAFSRRQGVAVSTPMKNIPNKRGVCIHLNGSISCLTPETLDNEFKLTNRSYNFDDLLSTEWFSLFKDDLYSAKAIFFIGFSGEYDLDLKRVFQSTKELKEKTFFIISPTADELEIMRLEDFGQILTIGLEGFVKLMEDQQSVTTKTAIKLPVILKSFQHIQSFNIVPRLEMRYVLKLFTIGDLDEKLLDYSLREPQRFIYAVYRNNLKTLLDLIYSGERMFVVQSALGNGKSIFIESAALELAKKGYSVYIYRNGSSSLVDEINTICQEKNAVIIIENYSSSIDVLRKINRFKTDDTVLILSERTARHEVAYSQLDFFNESFNTIDVNELAINEAEALISIFDKYGLWGKYAHYSNDQKIKHILNKCQGEISTAIISLLSEKQFSNRYALLLKSLQEHSEFYQVVMYILFSKYFCFPLEYRQLTESMGMNAINNPSFKNNECIRELVNFDDEKIRFKSSVLSYFLLKNNFLKNL